MCQIKSMIDKANCRSRGHSCLRHCSKKLSKLQQLAVPRAGMPAAPMVCFVYFVFSLLILLILSF